MTSSDNSCQQVHVCEVDTTCGMFGIKATVDRQMYIINTRVACSQQ